LIAATSRNGPDDISYAAEHIWIWFDELSRSRGSNGFGLNPIGYPDIAAWARLTGREPTPWEVSVLRRMDNALLESLAKKSDPKKVGLEIAPDDWQSLERALDRLG
jgi:hypothetical protein